jgi:hypothetical protein
MNQSIWYQSMREAGHSHEVCESEVRALDVSDELADITTAELLDEMVIRIECTNGLEIVSKADIAKLITLLVNHLAVE